MPPKKDAKQENKTTSQSKSKKEEVKKEEAKQNGKNTKDSHNIDQNSDKKKQNLNGKEVKEQLNVQRSQTVPKKRDAKQQMKQDEKLDRGSTVVKGKEEGKSKSKDKINVKDQKKSEAKQQVGSHKAQKETNENPKRQQSVQSKGKKAQLKANDEEKYAKPEPSKIARSKTVANQEEKKNKEQSPASIKIVNKRQKVTEKKDAPKKVEQIVDEILDQSKPKNRKVPQANEKKPTGTKKNQDEEMKEEGKKVEEKKAPLKKAATSVAKGKKGKKEEEKKEEPKTAVNVRPKRGAAAAKKKDDEKESDFELSDEDEIKYVKKLTKKKVARGVPQNAKPALPKAAKSKKGAAAIPPEYLLHVQDPASIEIPEQDEIRESIANSLINDDCCINCTNKNVHRACFTQNYDLLRQCQNSTKKISNLLTTWSPEVKYTPVEVAFQKGDMDMLELLLEFDKQKIKAVKERIVPPSYLIQQFDTGMVSESTYGVQVRAVNMSRGNRQGNNAFLEEMAIEETNFKDYLTNEYFQQRMVHMENLKVEHIEKLMKMSKSMNQEMQNLLQDFLLAGRRDIAEMIMKPFIDDPIYQVNKLIYACLFADDIKDLPDNYNKLSVNKIATKFGNICALHTAALNPNLDILKRLLNMIQADVNLKFASDNKGNQCIHYAAACEGSGPLELLIARGFNLNYANNEKETPLMIAVKANKPHNVMAIVQEDEESVYYKDSHGCYPIHVAAKMGNLGCIKALVKVDKKQVDVVGGYNKLTPLMYAVAYGHFETVQYLVKTLRANVNLEDKFKRNAITYAVRNGHLKIAAFLLQNMAFFNYPDSSKNFPLHYAAAYGWSDCLKLLLKSGANVNCQNEWGYSPLMVAMLKNHKKIVKQLLDIEGVDVNGTDDEGRNLLCYALQQVNQETLKYVKFLIKEKGADPNQADVHGRTPLFYLLQARLQHETAAITQKDFKSDSYLKRREQEQEDFIQLFKFMTEDVGCKLDVTDKNNVSIFQQAINENKYFLLPMLRDHIDLNKMSSVMMQFDATNPDIEIILRFIKDHPKIEDQYLHALYSNQQTLVHHLVNSFNYQKNLQDHKPNKLFRLQNIEQFLMTRRVIDIVHHLEEEKSIDSITPKQSYYQDLVDKEFHLFNIGMVRRAPQYTAMQRQFSKEQYEEAVKAIQTKFGEEKGEQFYAQKARDVIYDRIIVKNYIRLIKAWIDKGLNLNTYSFKLEYVAEKIYNDKENIMKKGMIPMTFGENQKILAQLQKEYKQAQEEKQELQKDKTFNHNARPDLNKIINNGGWNGIIGEALQGRNPEFLEFLLKNGLDVNQTNQDNQGVMIKLTQFYSKEKPLFKRFFEVLKSFNVDINQVNMNGDNAFLMAFAQNDMKVVKYLLKQKFDPNFKNTKNETALIMAVKRNNYDEAEMLLDLGASPNIQDDKGRTALHYAVNNSSSNIDASFDMESLLIGHGADVNIQDKVGRTPLHYAFVKIGRGNMDSSPMDPIETVSSLCTVQNANCCIQDKYGKNVLHYAAQRGATISTMYLEKKGVDLHQKDIFGNTPLATALFHKHSQYAIMLIKEGSDVNQLVYPETKEAYEAYKKSKGLDKEEKKKSQTKIVQNIENDIDMENDEDNNVDEDQEEREGNNEDSNDSYFKAAPAQNVYNSYNYGGGSLFGQQNNLFGGYGNNYNNYNYNHAQNNQASQIKEPHSMFKLAVDQAQLGLSYLILDNGFDLMKAMEDSLKRNKFQLVLTLLQKVSDDKQIQSLNEKKQNLFHVFAQNAAFLNTPAQVKLLSRIYKQFKTRGIRITDKDVNGRTPLHYAAMSGSYSLIAEFLKEENIDFNILDKFQLSPIILSIRGKKCLSPSNFEVFKTLAKSGRANFKGVYYTDKSYSEDIATAGEKGYQLTPYLHIIRQIQNMADNQATQWMHLWFMDPINQNLYEVDSLKRDTIMILVKQNNLKVIESVFKVWEDIHQKDTSKLALVHNKDSEGKSVMHYIVQTSKFGTYDNVEMFEFFLKKGYSYDFADIHQKKSIDYAAEFKDSQIYKKLLKLGAKLSAPQRIMVQTEIEDADMIEIQPYDFENDAEKFLKANEDKIVIEKEKQKLQPDEILGKTEALEVVYENPEDYNTAYEANLVRIDLKRYGYSAYLFYKIQLVRDTLKDIYILLTKWGQIGEMGMCQKTPFNKLEDAIADFKKVFKNKTSNNWDERANFHQAKAKNKYTLMTIMRPTTDYKDLLKPFEYDKCQQSKLPLDIQSFLRKISNIGMYNEVLKMNNIEKSQVNMTHFSKENLVRAREIIEEVEEIIKIGLSIYSPNYEENQKQIMQLSSEFFKLIPLKEFMGSIPRPLSQNVLVDYKNKIYDMITLERASKILLGALQRQKEISPLDYVYSSLQTQITPLSEQESDFQILNQYIKQTGQANYRTIKITNIFKISRQEEEQVFKKKNYNKDPNRILLFHGTSEQNLLGILNCGLKVTPMGVAQCGQAFGSGIYFADQFDKSIAYARQSVLPPDNELIKGEDAVPKRYVLICEIALGKIVKYEQVNYHPTHSAIGTQKQLQYILEELKKPVEEEEKEEEENDSQYSGSYFNSDSDDDYKDLGDDDEEMEEEVGFATKATLSQGTAADPVSKDQIVEGKDGKIKLGKPVDPSRTIRGRKLMKLNNTKKLSIFDTYWVGGNATPDPAFNLLTKDGCIVPNGKPIPVTEKNFNAQRTKNKWGGYNNNQYFNFQGVAQSEYVVKNPQRVKIRYIVEVRSKTAEELAKEQKNNSVNSNEDDEE